MQPTPWHLEGKDCPAQDHGPKPLSSRPGQTGTHVSPSLPIPRLHPATLNFTPKYGEERIELAKKFIWVFPYYLMDKLKPTFWPTQCFLFLVFASSDFGPMPLLRVWESE